MERYLEGEEIGGEELARALEAAVFRGELFPVGCGVATQNLGTTGLLDLLVEAFRRRPRSSTRPRSNGAAAFVFKTVADPFAGRITVFRVLRHVKGDSTLVNTAHEGKERLGQLARPAGQGAPTGAGVRRRRHRRRREAEGGDDRRRSVGEPTRRSRSSRSSFRSR